MIKDKSISNLRVHSEKIFIAVQQITLFMAAMNFQAKCFYFLYFIILLSIFSSKKKIVPASFVYYFLLCGIMTLYNLNEGVLSVFRTLIPMMMFVIGFNVIGLSSQTIQAEEYTRNTIVTIALGLFSHYLLNMINNISVSNISRNTIDIWTGESMAATGQALLAFFVIGIGISIILAPKKYYYRLLGIIILAVTVFYDLLLACRSILYLILIVSIVGIWFYLKESHIKQKYQRLIFMIIGVCVLFFVFFHFNIGGISDYIEKSNLFNRLSTIKSDDTRLSAKILYLKSFFSNMWGGKSLRAQYGYAHDLLLDGYDEYGIVVFILLMVILLKSVYGLLTLIRNRKISFNTRMLVLCVYITLYIAFAMEPVIESTPYLLSFWFLWEGMILGLRKVSKGEERRDEYITS